MRAQPVPQPHSCGDPESGFPLLIDGEWRASQSGAHLAAHDPYLEKDWGHIADATAADIDAAVQSASRAFASRCDAACMIGRSPASGSMAKWERSRVNSASGSSFT